jgi:hypothetical protein
LEGIIYATGSVTLNGGGGEGINVHGQIYAGTLTVTDITIKGGNTLGYDSCTVKKVLASQAFKVVSWNTITECPLASLQKTSSRDSSLVPVAG